jgi:hypothetical protein
VFGHHGRQRGGKCGEGMALRGLGLRSISEATLEHDTQIDVGMRVFMGTR